MKPRIVMIGPFPPPIHGVAVVNTSVLDQIRLSGAKPIVIDVASPTLDGRLLKKLTRFPKVLLLMVRLAGMRAMRGAKIYISVSGGLGQLYETIFIALARLKGMTVFLHHHSFAYLDTRKAYTRLLTKTAGSSSLHITLSDRMAEKLRSLYSTPRTISVSNAVFCLQKHVLPSQPGKKIRTIGFISNISSQKGVLEFLDLMTAIEAGSLPLHAMVAGPFQDPLIEQTVCERVSMLQNVEYLGPKFGADKVDFFKQIDVLAFPTRYENEAEPLIILEAMSHGVPTIAYARGCIPEIIHAGCGRVVDTDDDFVAVALEQIRHWLCKPTAYETASRSAAQHFLNIYAQNSRQWGKLLKNLTDGLPSDTICS